MKQKQHLLAYMLYWTFIVIPVLLYMIAVENKEKKKK